MPRPRFENLEPDKKARLLDAARKEFAARGYELASINTILDEAGFSKGSFYYHFDDKADLALTLITEENHRAWAHLASLAQPSTPAEFWAELKRISLESLQTFETDRVRYEAFMRIANALMTDPKMVARVAPLFEEGRRAMVGFFERGVSIGALRSDLPIGTLMELMQSMKMSVYRSLYPGDRVLPPGELHKFTDLVIDLVKRVCSR